MFRYRRRKKRPFWKSFLLWSAGLSLVGWGLYQAAQFRQRLVADFQQAQARAAEEGLIARPSVAVGGVSIAPRDAWGSARDGAPARQGAAGADPVGDGATLEIVDAAKDTEIVRRAPRILPHFAPLPIFEATLTPADLIARGMNDIECGRIAEGRSALNAALYRTTDESDAQCLRDMLADLNMGVFLGSEVLPEDPLACYIDIEPGDSYLRLAREFGIPTSHLELINPSLNPRNLKPLTGVKIVKGPFRIQVVKHASRLDLYLGDLYIRSYHVSLPEGNYLPRGDYRIAQGGKLQVANRAWIGFEGTEEANETVESGWIFGSWGPRGTSARNRATGIMLADADLLQLYNVLVESRSHLHVEP
jgi:hypothetical protein